MLGESDKPNEPIKNTQSAAIISKPKRELPPLKKLRSVKKIIADEYIEKENTTVKTMEEYLENGFSLPTKQTKHEK